MKNFKELWQASPEQRDDLLVNTISAPFSLMSETGDTNSQEGLTQSVYLGNISQVEIISTIENDWHDLSWLSDEALELLKLFIKNSAPKNILIINSDSGYLIHKLAKWRNIISVNEQSNSSMSKVVNYLFPEITIIEGDVNSSKNNQKFDIVIVNHGFDFVIKKALSKVANSGQLIIISSKKFLSASYPEAISFRNQLSEDYSLEMIVEYEKFGLILINYSDRNEKTFVIDGSNQKAINIYNNYQEQISEFLISNDKLNFRWDIHFHRSETNPPNLHDVEFNFSMLEDVCEVILEGMDLFELKPYISTESGYQIVNSIIVEQNEKTESIPSTVSNFEEGKLWYLSEQALESNFANRKFIIKPGDLVLSLHGPNYYSYIFKKGSPKSIASSDCAILRSPHNDYLRKIFRTESGQEMLNKYSDPNSSSHNIDIEGLKKVFVPISSTGKPLESSQVEEYYKIIINKMDSIADNQKNFEKKFDDFATEFKNEFSRIKNSSDNIDDKLNKLYDSIDKRLAEGTIDYDKFERKVIDTLEIKQWNKLDDLSKSFLPSAEFLRFHIEQYREIDWSPVIIQLCRALENEIAQKIFAKYIYYLIDEKLIHVDHTKEANKQTGLKNIIADEFKSKFQLDFELKETGKARYESGNRIATSILDGVKYDPSVDKFIWKIELGGMGLSLEKLTGEQAKSPILIDFSNYIKRYFDENVLEKEYLKRITAIAGNYRNKAAHPYHIDADKARQGWDEILEILKKFVEYYNG